MPFSNYTELQATVADWMHRKNLSGVAVDCIALAESRMKARLWSQMRDKATSLTTVQGVASVALPTDFLSVRALSIPGHVANVEYVTPGKYSELSVEQASGLPRSYTLIGNDLWLAATPDKAYPLLFMYAASFPSLSQSAPTNDLLAKWPDLYLWGALAEACIYTQNSEFLAVCEARYGDALDAIIKNEWSAAGSMRLRCDNAL